MLLLKLSFIFALVTCNCEPIPALLGYNVSGTELQDESSQSSDQHKNISIFVNRLTNISSNDTRTRKIRSYYGDVVLPHFETNRNNFRYGTHDENQRNSVSQRNEEHVGIEVASWSWDSIKIYFTFTAFIVVTGLAKVAFHHAHWLSSRVPESCLMIIVGVVVGGILYSCGVTGSESEINNYPGVIPSNEQTTLPTFTPTLFFMVLLPPVILESAYSLYDRSFADNLFTVLLYAVVGTIFNTFLIGPLLYLIGIGGLMGQIYLPMTEAIVFSALISAVDPVAVLAIFQEVGVNKDLYYLLFGESLLNDAVTIVLYATTERFTEMSTIYPSQYGLAILKFFTVSFGGLAIGIIFGLITALLTKTTQDVRVVEPLAVLGIAYLSYLSAELFHFSGIISIIGCGLVQSHYALKNISENSKITVTYFTKMISSTSDAIIFLFLGMVLVSNRHVWHTGFVLWTLLLCLLCRFFSVFLLTAIANVFRVKQINCQEQFIMAYGGLRGAVAFSLVEMLKNKTSEPRSIFLTTTLVVILFTVFIQGGTIKCLVNLLNIEKLKGGERTMNQEINEYVISTMMAGIEEITGVRGDYYLRRKFEYIDEMYLSKVFLNTTKSNSLTRLYEKLALTQHYAHLYGPVTLIEDKNVLILHQGTTSRRKLPRSMSARQPTRPSLRISNYFPGVQLRRRTLSDTTRPPDSPLMEPDIRTSTEQLRKAFKSNVYEKYHDRYDRNILNDRIDLSNLLQRRQDQAHRITQSIALSNRHSTTPITGESMEDTDEEFAPSRRQIHSELEAYPQILEGVQALISRARERLARQSSNAEVFADEGPHVRRHTTSETSSLQHLPTQPLLKTSSSISPKPLVSVPKLKKSDNSLGNSSSSIKRQHSVGTRHPTYSDTQPLQRKSPGQRRYFNRSKQNTPPPPDKTEDDDSDESKV